jgi:hypothetical protein
MVARPVSGQSNLSNEVSQGTFDLRKRPSAGKFLKGCMNKKFWYVGVKYVDMKLFEQGYPCLWGDGVTEWGYDYLKDVKYDIQNLLHHTGI